MKSVILALLHRKQHFAGGMCVWEMWLTNWYLEGRGQTVVFNGKTSQMQIVPQDSVLGPLLCIYDFIYVKMNLNLWTVYAEDTNFCIKKILKHFLSIFNKEYQPWFDKITIKFGVLVDQNITWKEHIHSVVSKLSSVYFLIRQLWSTVSFTYKMYISGMSNLYFHMTLFLGDLQRICMKLT